MANTENYKNFELNKPRLESSQMGWRELENFKKLIDKDEAQDATIAQNAALTENRFANVQNSITNLGNALGNEIGNAKADLISRIIAVYGNQYDPDSNKTNIALSDRIDGTENRIIAIENSMTKVPVKRAFRAPDLTGTIKTYPIYLPVKVQCFSFHGFDWAYPDEWVIPGEVQYIGSFNIEYAPRFTEFQTPLDYGIDGYWEGYQWLKVRKFLGIDDTYGRGCPFPDPVNPAFFPASNNAEWVRGCVDGNGYYVKGPVDSYVGQLIWDEQQDVFTWDWNESNDASIWDAPMGFYGGLNR